MGLFDIFRVPGLPSAPRGLTSYRVIDKATFLAALQPWDIGFTFGSGFMALMENIIRVKEKEGDDLFTHAFGVYAPGADPECYESNWPKVHRGFPASTYIGAHRHAVFARYKGLTDAQRGQEKSAVDMAVAAQTPYGAVQIPAFGGELVGVKPSDWQGVTCIELVTDVLRGAVVPFITGTPSFVTTPTRGFTYVKSPQGIEDGWEIVAESIGEMYYLPL